MTREPLDLPQPPSGEILKVSIGDRDFLPATGADRTAVSVLRRICDEIDEGRTYRGFDLIVWLTGISNGIASGSMTATDGAEQQEDDHG